jgi:hypothetical protein
MVGSCCIFDGLAVAVSASSGVVRVATAPDASVWSFFASFAREFRRVEWGPFLAFLPAVSAY